MPTSQNSQNQSLTANVEKLVALRMQLGWTQEVVGQKAGYSDRLIRKIEKRGAVRPQTLQDVLQCYHEANGLDQWRLEDFVSKKPEADGTAATTLVVDCENCRRLKAYFTEVYCERKQHKIDEYCCPNIRLTAEGSNRLGIESIHQRAGALLTAFNPINFEFEKIHSIDQIVFLFWAVRMKHTGDFFEIPASNRWIDLRGNSVAQFADGLVVDAEDHFDVESIVRQIKGQSPRVI